MGPESFWSNTVHSPRSGPSRWRWLLVVALALGAAACRWPGSGNGPTAQHPVSDGAVAGPAPSPTALAGSGSGGPGSVSEATAGPGQASPPTLTPGSDTGASPSGVGTATTTPAAGSGSSDPGAPAAAPAPRPAAAPATPGVMAQPGDPNDAFGGGGPVRCPVFPGDNWWNRQVSNLPVHPRSAAWVASLGNGNLHPDFGTVWDAKAIGIPYVVVDGSQARVPVSFDYAGESDPGPYPIPVDAPIEDGSDHHVIVIDDTNCVLYELFDAAPLDGGTRWRAGSGAVHDLRSNALRPAGWTSADAAGLPIFAGLVTYDEVVVQGLVDHALRFTAGRTQRAYIRPATHFASSITDPDVPPMGARFRLKADHDCTGFSAEIQVVCAALKTYGMFLADNGSDWLVSGAPDPRWNDRALADLRKIPGSAFEVVDTGEAVTR